MQKIYGYKESDLLALGELVAKRKNQTLTAVFSEYAIKYGKAKGTVRNMYYALTKACEKDEKLKKKYFHSHPVSVNKTVEFKPCEVRALVAAVLKGKNEGKSARSVINELSRGDVKLALRYQNKYRSTLKANPEFIDEVAKSLKLSPVTVLKKPQPVSDAQLNRLKKEIDGLVERLSSRALRENDRLRNRVAVLEAENLRLTKALYSSNAIDVMSILRKNTDMVN